MRKYTIEGSVLVLCALVAGCGGSSSSSSASTASDLETNIVTATSSGDTLSRWNCSITGSQLGNTEQTLLFFTDFTGIAGEPGSGAEQATTWSAIDDNTIDLSFSADPGFDPIVSRFTSVVFVGDNSSFTSDVDEFVGFSTELASYACDRSTALASPGSIAERLITGSGSNDLARHWSCIKSDSSVTNFYFWSDGNGQNIVDNGAVSDFTWTADDATNALTAVTNQGSAGLNSIQFASSGDSFTAQDVPDDQLLTCALTSGPIPPQTPSNVVSFTAEDLATGDRFGDFTNRWNCEVGIGQSVAILFFSDGTGVYRAPENFRNLDVFPSLRTQWELFSDGSMDLTIFGETVPDETWNFADIRFNQQLNNFTADVDDLGASRRVYDCTKTIASKEFLSVYMTTGIDAADTSLKWSCLSNANGIQDTYRFWGDGNGQHVDNSGFSSNIRWRTNESSFSVETQGDFAGASFLTEIHQFFDFQSTSDTFEATIVQNGDSGTCTLN